MLERLAILNHSMRLTYEDEEGDIHTTMVNSSDPMLYAKEKRDRLQRLLLHHYGQKGGKLLNVEFMESILVDTNPIVRPVKSGLALMEQRISHTYCIAIGFTVAVGIVTILGTMAWRFGWLV